MAIITAPTAPSSSTIPTRRGGALRSGPSSPPVAPAGSRKPTTTTIRTPTGVGPGVTNNHNGVRFSTALGYLEPARHRLNLTVRPNCQVRRIVFEGTRAVGLLVESGGDTFTVEAEQIILSAGAVGSPHLLLLSGVGPAGQLESLGIPVALDLPGVGQNLKGPPESVRNLGSR